MSTVTESSPSLPSHQVAPIFRNSSAPQSLPRTKASNPITAAISGTVLANVLIIVSTILRSGVALLLMPVLIAFLGSEQYALWVTISTVTMYLSLSESGLGQTVVNKVGDAYARGDLQRVAEVQATAHVMYWILIIPTAIVALVGLAWLPIDRWLLSSNDLHHGPELIACLAVSTVLALARIPMLVFPGLLSGFRQLPLRLACEIAATLLVAAGIVAAAWLGCRLMGIVVVSNLILFVANVGVGVLVVRGRPWAKLRLSHFRADLLWPLAANSGFFFLMSLSAVLDRSLLTLLVAKFGSLTLAPPVFLLLNIFRVAAWSMISAVSRAIQPYVLMWQTQDDLQLIATIAALLTKLTTFAACIIAAAFLPFAELIVDTWLGRGSFPGTTPVYCIIGAFLIDAVFLASGNLMVVMKGYRQYAVLVGLKSLLLLVFAALFGACTSQPLVGITAGVLVATLLGNAAMPVVAWRTLEVEPRHYIAHLIIRPFALSLATFVAAVAASTIVNLPTRLTATSGLLIVAAVAAWAVMLSPLERQICRRLWMGVRTGINLQRIRTHFT